MPPDTKPIPKSVLIFGAAAHIGRPLAEFLQREAPSIKLRLATSSPSKIPGLQTAFPSAEVVVADFYDTPTLEAAVAGIEGVFIITPGGTDEGAATSNIITALRTADTAVHVLKLVGLQPEANPRRIPEVLRHQRSLPVQHALAKQLLDASGLPVTYLNCGATFIDNFFWMKRGLKEERTLIWPERLIPFVDPRDVGEVAARLLLSPNQRHIGQFHTLNNGHDLLRFKDVAELMSEVWGEKIAYESSKEAFFAEYAPHMGEGRANALWEFFRYEEQNEVVWAPNKFVEITLGRKPTTVREWLLENKQALLN
ncbi:putative family protein [Neofusicoccum parvum UCRNP2]|uniref:Putative family protein n=1 Tax=Botryosphaeria parva (strain UCR-NP2) TaxID=1287680 RepID=R1G3X1_BOTPV|nr:putative family protein [Neofusicoccum parvum UCRNP2]